MSTSRRALLAACALLALALALCFAPSHATLLATPLERASPLLLSASEAGEGYVFAQLVDSDLGDSTALALAETDSQAEAEGFFDDLVKGIKNELNTNPAARQAVQGMASNALQAVQAVASRKLGEWSTAGAASVQQKWSGSTLGQIGADVLNTAVTDLNAKIVPAVFNRLQVGVSNRIDKFAGVTPSAPAPAQSVKDAVKETARDSAQTAANDAVKVIDGAATKIVGDLTGAAVAKAEEKLSGSAVGQIGVDAIKAAADKVNQQLLPSAIDQLQQRLNDAVSQIGAGSQSGSSGLFRSAAPPATNPAFTTSPLVAPWLSASAPSSMDSAISSIFSLDFPSRTPTAGMPSRPTLVSPRRGFFGSLSQADKDAIRLSAQQAALLGSSRPLPKPRLHIHDGFKLPGRAPTASELSMEAERARQLRVAHRLHRQLYMMNAQLQEQRQVRIKAEEKQVRARQQRQERRAARRAGQGVAGKKAQRAARRATKAKRSQKRKVERV